MNIEAIFSRFIIPITIAVVIFSSVLTHTLFQFLIGAGLMGQDISLIAYGVLTGIVFVVVDEIIAGIMGWIIDRQIEKDYPSDDFNNDGT